MPAPLATIMIVEDEALIRMDLAYGLAELGHDVVEAAHAADALELLDAGPAIDVIVTDIDMPGDMNGLALAREVRRRLEDCRIIIMSGGSVPDEAKMAERSVFIRKPLALADLVKAMR